MTASVESSAAPEVTEDWPFSISVKSPAPKETKYTAKNIASNAYRPFSPSRSMTDVLQRANRRIKCIKRGLGEPPTAARMQTATMKPKFNSKYKDTRWCFVTDSKGR